jgi:hypothetical protein
MALLGCGEIWSKVSSAVTAWSKQSLASSTWAEAVTYCPLGQHTIYDDTLATYDAIDVTYDRV